MELKQWKKAYPTATEYYDAFHSSQEGNEAWNLAYKALEQDWDEDGDDEEPVVVAHDIVINSMERWLLNDVKENEYDKASEWFEKMQEELSESIYAGLT